jgi:hypothetical protein
MCPELLSDVSDAGDRDLEGFLGILNEEENDIYADYS